MIATNYTLGQSDGYQGLFPRCRDKEYLHGWTRGRELRLRMIRGGEHRCNVAGSTIKNVMSGD